MGLPSQYQEVIFKSRYARWIDSKKRRETWEETVKRYIHFFVSKYSKEEIDYDAVHEAEEAILNLEVMPSMRALMCAGDALDRDNVAGYNCSYLVLNRPRAFDEMMYILMCGTGVGYSVERDYVNELPKIAEEFSETETTISVADSKVGWAKSFRELLSLLWAGQIPKWDMSKVRPAGERLKTFGGRASGPQPLEDLFNFSVSLFQNAAGRRLTSLEAHDLACKVADIVVVGGVRRSALISLSNLGDSEMRHAKGEGWYYVGGDGTLACDTPHRALANNSVCYTRKPDLHTFIKEGLSLYDSKSGERGIFNREASKKQAGKNGRRDNTHAFGTNPCSEIILRDRQFCNLTEVVVRPEDTLDDLKRKVKVATILGTLQSTLTEFRYLSKKWKDNTEEEALLGVSLTGILDHAHLSGRDMTPIGLTTQLGPWLQELREVAVETNKEWASRLGINQSCAITCVKPSGTVSQLVDSASGIHPRHSHYYIRRIRQDNKDPLTTFLKEQGVSWESALGKEDSTTVFSFPMAAPKNAIYKEDITALEHLELWKTYQEHWCEHKPSVTISVKEDEWLAVLAWVWANFDITSGISFLPYDGGVYQQAPYEAINEEEYNDLSKTIPALDWELMERYESTDNTTGTHELSCSAGGGCEL